MNSDWSHFKIVLAIKRAGNLTGAALLLNMDQTTVGRRLSTLEQQLGSILFVRSKMGFTPTEQGDLVAKHAHKVEQTVSQMRDDLTRVEGGVAGILRLQANSWMLEKLAGGAVSTLLDAHPRLELRLSGRLPPAVQHGEATVSLWFDAPPLPSEFTIPLCTVPYGLYEAAENPSKPDQWVMFQDDEAKGPSIAHEIRRRLGKHQQVRMTATDANMLRAAIRGGVGRGIIPWCLAQSDPTLRCLSGDRPEIERQLFAHVHPNTVESNRVQLALAWLRNASPKIFSSRGAFGKVGDNNPSI